MPQRDKSEGPPRNNGEAHKWTIGKIGKIIMESVFGENFGFYVKYVFQCFLICSLSFSRYEIHPLVLYPKSVLIFTKINPSNLTKI